MQKMRRAVIAMDQLDAEDQIQIDGTVYTLTAEPHLVAGGSRWQIETTTCTREYFDNSVTIIVPLMREHTDDEIAADWDHALEIAEIYAFEQARYEEWRDQFAEIGPDPAARIQHARHAERPWAYSARYLRARDVVRYRELLAKHGKDLPVVIDQRLTESSNVHVDMTGPVRHGIPEVGDFILVGNAGGRHQSPGSYGYTRTEVLAIEHNKDAGVSMHRLTTRAYGQSCWVSSNGGQSLICVTE